MLNLNSFFDKEAVKEQKPYVVSPLPPYYIDYYSNGNYLLLPLDPQQEFRSYKEQAWGDYDYSNLHKQYTALLDQGSSLYVATYGLGNEEYLHASFSNLKENFKLQKVSSGCYDLCDIYKVEKLQTD